MDFPTGFGVFLGFIALALTVTPGITNRWAASVAWLVVALYAVWLFGPRQEQISAFVSGNRALAGSGAVGLLLVFLAYKRRSKRVALHAAAAGEALRRREFEDFPVELGIVDHGVNTEAALRECVRLLHCARPAVSRIFEQLFKDTPARLPSRDDPNGVVKKQAVIRASARTLQPDVLILEDVAAQITPQARTLLDAYRAILKLPVSSAADVQKLREMKSLFAGTIVPAFQQCAELLRARSHDIARLSGMQQDLTRVVQRSVIAIDQIAVAVESIAAFYSDELPTTIEHLLKRATLSGSGPSP